jgi:hypothetical protein
MELVDSVPQYATIVKHCRNLIRAILSIHADAMTAMYCIRPSAQPDAPRASVLATTSASLTAAKFATSASPSVWNTPL